MSFLIKRIKHRNLSCLTLNLLAIKNIHNNYMYAVLSYVIFEHLILKKKYSAALNISKGMKISKIRDQFELIVNPVVLLFILWNTLHKSKYLKNYVYVHIKSFFQTFLQYLVNFLKQRMFLNRRKINITVNESIKWPLPNSPWLRKRFVILWNLKTILIL